MGFKKSILISLLVGLVGTVAIFSTLFYTGVIPLPYSNSAVKEGGTNDIDVYNSVFETGICNDEIPTGCTYWYNTIATKGFAEIYELGESAEIGSELVAGQSLVTEPQTGDIFVDGDNYMYVYNMKATKGGKWIVDETLDGWGVRRISLNKKDSYTKIILNTINHKPVVCASYAFEKALITPKELTIPATIKDISGMFASTNPLKINITFEGTPEKYTDCFKESNGFYITEDGRFCDFNTAAIVKISGNCDKDVLNKISQTSEHDNIIIS